MDGPLQRPPDQCQDEGIRRRRTQPEPGALPTLAPSKWVAEGRKGDLSRAHKSLSPQSRMPQAKPSKPWKTPILTTVYISRRGSRCQERFRPDGRVTLFRQSNQTICADVRPRQAGVPSCRHRGRGPRRRAIHGPTALSRHPCRSTPSTTPAFGLPYARLASSVRLGVEDQDQRQR